MDIKKRRGTYIQHHVKAHESYHFYVPSDLPFEPWIDMEKFYPLLDKANISIGRLNGMSMVLPDASLFLYMYIRKEAVLSSQIEGTQSSLSDLLLYENDQIPGVPIDDVTEVSCYVSALDYGLKRLEELPLSLRLIKEIHAKLMENARGGHQSPGEFRTSQNWIGGTRPGNALYVPPSPEYLMKSLDNFEKFIHDEKTQLPALIKAAIVHAQFETIHPFLDGNGRLGRLLITFILYHEGILKEPLLYLSLYLKSHKQRYYELLQSTRETGDWESWIEFFLEAVIETANQATQTAQKILKLFNDDRKMIENSAQSTASTLAIHHYLQHHPITNTKKVKEECHISLPTALRSLATLENLGIIEEITKKERKKIFAYSNYIKILNQGIEPKIY